MAALVAPAVLVLQELQAGKGKIMRYAVIENQKVVNIVEADPEFAATQGWVECPSNVSFGWTFNGSGEMLPPVPNLEELASLIRSERDSLLAETDWTQAGDVPQATKDKWAPYRQALRDVPQQAGFPNNVTWPNKPE